MCTSEDPPVAESGAAAPAACLVGDGQKRVGKGVAAGSSSCKGWGATGMPS